MDLFDDDDHDGGDELGNNNDQLVVNTSFAKAYESRKRKRELAVLADRHGADDDASSTSYSTEDEDAVLDTKRKGLKFLEALPLIAAGRPKPWQDGAKQDAEEEEEAEGAKSKTAGKSAQGGQKMSEFVTQALLKDGATALLSDDDEDGPRRHRRQPDRLVPYDAEQKRLKQEFLKAIDGGADNDGDDGDGDDDAIFKTKSSASKSADTAPVTPVPEHVRSYWADNTVNEKEQFLRDYVLNQRWLDHSQALNNDDDGSESGSESSFVDRQEDFESKYNFRYEEEGGGTIAGVMRPTAATPALSGSSRLHEKKRRSEKDRKRKERKLQEQEERDREVRRLKALRKQEIEEKLEQLARDTAAPAPQTLLTRLLNDDRVLSALDDGDEFDPEKHDLVAQRIAELLDEEDVDHGKKPQFSDDLAQQFGLDADDDNDDNDNDGNDDDDSSVQDDVPEFGGDGGAVAADRGRKPPPEQATAAADLLSDYVKLGQKHTAAAGGRFKYTRVVPIDGGMDVDEILTLDDKVLNSRLSLRTLAPFRSDQAELAGRNWAKERRRWEKREKYAPNLYPPPSTSVDRGKSVKIDKAAAQTTKADSDDEGQRATKEAAKQAAKQAKAQKKREKAERRAKRKEEKKMEQSDTATAGAAPQSVQVPSKKKSKPRPNKRRRK